ncbi:MAG: restriction endonuclease [Kiritimatiellia bacterium]|jgi:hypothetical protein
MISTELKSLFTRARVLGQGSDRIFLSEAEVAWLLKITASDLDIVHANKILSTPRDSPTFYEAPIPPKLPEEWSSLTGEALLEEFSHLCAKKADARLYFTNLCSIFKRRIKFQRILTAQAKPTMDQIGPRSLLEYGVMPTDLLGNWMLWRKWIFDIDNRSGQETGYLFEPILASCIGGVSVGSSNSPVRRINDQGKKIGGGRQIDCLDANDKIAYEFKLRVSIAASGQGRFGEELSFPVECKAAGLTPVLIVLDPTPSPRLTELKAAFENAGGYTYIGDAWDFIKSKAGDCMSTFIDKYLRPVLLQMASYDDTPPKPITLEWEADNIQISTSQESFRITRTREPEATLDEKE